MTALAQVPEALRALPVLNAYRFGGFLIVNGVRPFEDSRADLYGAAFLHDYLAIMHARPEYRRVAIQRHHIAWTILEPGSPLVAWLDSQPDWRRAYDAPYVGIRIQNKIPAEPR